MEEAGLVESHRKTYMGHGRQTMTDIYTRHDVRARLVGDAEKMRVHIGEPFSQIAVVR